VQKPKAKGAVPVAAFVGPAIGGFGILERAAAFRKEAGVRSRRAVPLLVGAAKSSFGPLHVALAGEFVSLVERRGLPACSRSLFLILGH
jgi:hypothetical protein